jgi:DnaK suppressor protein
VDKQGEKMNSEKIEILRCKFMGILDQLDTEKFIIEQKLKEVEELATINATDTVYKKRSFMQSLQQNDRLRKKIDEALDRMKNETFGKCEDCGLELNIERLLANPAEILCMFCKEEEQNNQHQLIRSQYSNVAIFPKASEATHNITPDSDIKKVDFLQ